MIGIPFLGAAGANLNLAPACPRKRPPNRLDRLSAYFEQAQYPITCSYANFAHP